MKVLKKSSRVNVRLKRLIKDLTEEGNRTNIGCVILEDIIIKGIEAELKLLKKRDPEKNYFIGNGIYKQTDEIIKKHLL